MLPLGDSLKPLEDQISLSPSFVHAKGQFVTVSVSKQALTLISLRNLFTRLSMFIVNTGKAVTDSLQCLGVVYS